MNFNDVGLDIPLNNKVKRGAKKKTKPSLQFQPPDCVQQQAENEILESEDDDELEIDERPAKIAKTSSQCSTSSLRCKSCDAEMKKKNGFYCPNGCKKNKK